MCLFKFPLQLHDVFFYCHSDLEGLFFDVQDLMPFVVICKFHYIVRVARGSVHSRSITWRWCPALTRSSRPRGQTSTWTKLKPGRWTVSLPLVPLLTFYFEVCERKCLAYSHLYLSPLLTGEVQRMLEEKNVSLSNVEPAPLDALWALKLSFVSCCVNQGKLKQIHDFICMHMLEQV